MKRFGKWVAGAVAFYFLSLLGCSLSSHEQFAEIHDAKKFCAADCDLSMAVESAEHQGGRYIVKIKVQSSAARVTMRPSSPSAILIDREGREYRGTDELDPLPFARPVGPGQSYVKTLVFHAPGVRDAGVFLNEGGWITRWVPGDENSFLHKKTLIRVP